MRWRLVVDEPNGDPLFRYGPEEDDGPGGIVGFPSFDIDVSGNCLTMQFTAIPQQCAIFPRDIITLERYDETQTDWVPWWKGIVTQAGTPYSDDPQEYQALGLKQAYYERVLLTNRWPRPPALSNDAATLPLADDGEFTLIPGVYVDPYTSAPELGFQVGVTLPNRQSVGDFLDARAKQVGQFIVPTGESYEYDGVTFSEDETVPEVRWGVDATGRFFFRRVAVNEFPPVQVNEDDPQVEVAWSPFTSEGRFNSFVFILVADVDRERLLTARVDQNYIGPPEFDQSFVSNEQTFVPYTAPGPIPFPDDPIVEQSITVDAPLDFMARENMTFLPNDLWSDLGNAVDGDTLTSALYGQPFTPISASGGTVTDVGDYRVHTFTTNDNFVVTNVGSNPEVEYLIVAGGGGGYYADSSVNPRASGGGAGGLRRGLEPITATTYPVVVGAGGAGGTSAPNDQDGKAGSSSSALGYGATGGGGGRRQGQAGGSGGGAIGVIGLSSGVGGDGATGQGNNGGNASNANATSRASGGGGAGAAAESARGSVVATAGGAGRTLTISGSAVTYATGGSARSTVGGGTSGTANSGDGGDGGVDVSGGAGGSGVVIIRYRLTDPEPLRAAGTAFDFSSPAVLESNPVGQGAGVFSLWYSSDEPVVVAIRRSGTLGGFTQVGSVFFSYTILTTIELQYEFPATNSDSEIRPRQVIIPALQPTNTGRNDLGSNENILFIQGINELRIHDVAFYAADPVLINRAAQSLVREPVSDAAVVVVNSYQPLTSRVEINTLGSFAVSIDVERVEYSLTVEEGVKTRYFAGQRFESRENSQGIVLSSLVRRLTKTKDSL
jgi:hypothetical protein